MKSTSSRIIDDFHDHEISELVKRSPEFQEIEGKADVAIGMCCFVKAYFCYKKIRGLGNAMKEYSIEKRIIITWDDEKTIYYRIEAVPAWKWMPGVS